MPKGFFTQGAAVLLSRAATLDELEPLLGAFKVVKRDDQGADPNLGGPSLIMAFRPEVNGYVQVDVQDRPWPDHMGDSQREVMLLGAWSMGHFGPFTFPGALLRAGQQSWSWQAARAIPAEHRAFVRIRTTYVFGAGKDALVMPADYEPLPELRFATEVARALLAHPAALAYFNPNGEVLSNGDRIDKIVAGSDELDVAPLNLWCNVRLFRADDGWAVMDSVGMEQVDRPDSEAVFLLDKYEPRDVDHFLRNVGLYLFDAGEVIEDRNTMDGPGGVRWRALHVEKPLMDPPRRVLRWFPLDGSRAPDALVDR